MAWRSGKLASAKAMSRRALVTGGGGFIGSHLVRALLAEGWQVGVLDRNPPRPLAESAPPDGDAVEHIQGSIADMDTLRTALHRVDVVYHLAALSALWLPRKRDYHRVNVEGTRNVLRAARAARVPRFVHCSTEAILKDWRVRDDAPLRETRVPPLEGMAGPYCRSKWLAEAAVREAAVDGLDAVIVNPTVPIGPGDWLLTPPARMLLGFLNGENPAYLENVFNVVDARDVALGHIRAAERGVTGKRYLLGGENLPLSALLQRLEALSGRRMPRRTVPWPVAMAAAQVEEGWARLTGREPRAPLTGVRLARSSLACDCEPSRAALGLASRPLDDSLRDTLEDFARRGLIQSPR